MRQFLWLLLSAALLIAAVAHAQDAPPVSPTGVYVTTQDFSVLRAGPSVRSDRLAVLPPVTTLPAVGRSPRTDWIQVQVGADYGWIAAHLLVWSGDVIALPVDGIGAEPFVRRAVVWARTFRPTPYYQGVVDPAMRLGVLPADAEFEVVGRLGTGDSFSLQIVYEGQQVWVGSWDVQILEGNLDNTLNANYRYPYGRLITRLDADVRQTVQRLGAVDALWGRLQRGEAVPCHPLPTAAVRLAVDQDIAREPIFAPVVLALDEAISGVNGALSRFAELCAAPQPVVTPDELAAAQTDLARAARNVTLAAALLMELRERDPLFN